MKSSQFLSIISALFLTSCSGGEDPGYLFHIIFIIIPLILIGHYVYRKLEATAETLYVIEGQLKRIITRLDKLEGDESSAKSGKSKKGKKED